MLEKVIEFVQKNPNLKGKDIAKKLGIEKAELNSLLHKEDAFFLQSKDWRWTLKNPDHLNIFIKSDSWVTASSFEDDLKKVGSLLDSSVTHITFHFPVKCQIFLVAGSRLIALVNQLSQQGKIILLNFKLCKATKNYLSRLGFFDYLPVGVDIVPPILEESRAKIYCGKNENIFEIAAIDPCDLNDSIPKILTKKFTKLSGHKYYIPIFTMFSELIGNICDHSNSSIHGFVALQKYKGRRPHIQTVVSDSGLGIATTIKQGLKEHYPEIFSSKDMNDIDTDIYLVRRALINGALSRHGKKGARGLGLKKSQDVAIKFQATTRVRQESFELKIEQKIDEKGDINNRVSVRKGMTRLQGTHVCFDFYLD